MATQTKIIGLHVPVEGRTPFTHIAAYRAAPALPEEITAPQALPPVLPKRMVGAPSSSSGPTVPVQGLTLEISIWEHVLVIKFREGGPLPLAEVAAAIMSQAPVLKAEHQDGQLYISSVLMGAAQSLEALLGDAAALLGLPTELRVWGKDARQRLDPEATLYLFLDSEGDPAYRYQYRLTNEATGALGPLSAPILPSTVAPQKTVEGKLTVLDGTGRAVPNRLVYLVPQDTQDSVLWGAGTHVTSDPITVSTDEDGSASVQLLRGVPYLLMLSGTKLTRRITTPADLNVQSFDLLREYGTDGDQFQIQEADYTPFYAKRTVDE